MECLRKLFSSCTNPKKTQIKENQISPTPVSERTLNITPNLNNTSCNLQSCFNNLVTTPAIQQSNILTKVPSSKSLARVNSHKDTALIQVISRFYNKIQVY